jgi:peroxiredoxin
MTRRILLLLGLVLPLALVQAREPRPVSEIPIPLPDGTKINLHQYKGKVVLLIVFSLTCPDCLQSLQTVNKIQKDLGPKGFQAIGGAGDDNASYQIGSLVQRYKLTFPIGYLNKEQMIALADIEKDRRPIAPIFIFIDKNSTVRYQFYGDHPFFKTAEGSTRTLIQGLLQGK